jgi:hypothetical protein
LVKQHPDPHRGGWTLFHRSFERPLFFGEPQSPDRGGGSGHEEEG